MNLRYLFGLLFGAFAAFNSAFADQKIVLNTMESIPYQSENLINQGFLVEISREAFSRMGYRLEVKFVPWKRAMLEAENGVVDGVLGAWYNEERTRLFEYTDVIAESKLVLLKRKSMNIEYNSIKDLGKYRIGVVGGYVYSEEFDQATYLEKEVVASTEINIRKLIFERIDITPDIEEVAYHILKSKHPDYVDSIDSIGEPLKVQLIYNIISKKNPSHLKIVEDFNRGLEMIKADGTYSRILFENGMSQ